MTLAKVSANNIGVDLNSVTPPNPIAGSGDVNGGMQQDFGYGQVTAADDQRQYVFARANGVIAADQTDVTITVGGILYITVSGIGATLFTVPETLTFTGSGATATLLRIFYTAESTAGAPTAAFMEVRVLTGTPLVTDTAVTGGTSGAVASAGVDTLETAPITEASDGSGTATSPDQSVPDGFGAWFGQIIVN